MGAKSQKKDKIRVWVKRTSPEGFPSIVVESLMVSHPGISIKVRRPRIGEYEGTVNGETVIAETADELAAELERILNK